LGVKGNTPGYLVRVEMNRWLLRSRARSFEERLEEGRGGVLAQRCLREMKERGRERNCRAGRKKDVIFLGKGE